MVKTLKKHAAESKCLIVVESIRKNEVWKLPSGIIYMHRTILLNDASSSSKEGALPSEY